MVRVVHDFTASGKLYYSSSMRKSADGVIVSSMAPDLARPHLRIQTFIPG